MRSLTSLIIVYQDFLDSATCWRPYWILMALLKFYNHINIEIKILDPENLRLGMFHHFLCQLQTETCKFIEFWSPYWISVTRLNFYGYIVEWHSKFFFLNFTVLSHFFRYTQWKKYLGKKIMTIGQCLEVAQSNSSFAWLEGNVQC